MKRRYWLLHLVLLCLLTCALAVGFLFGTTAGTRLLIAQVAHWSGIGIEFETIAGQIGYDLTLGGLRILTPDAELRITTLHMKWQPFYLASARMVIRQLMISGVLLHDKQPDKKTPIELTWPRMPSWMSLVDASIEDLRIERLNYQKQSEEPVVLEKVQSRVLWDHGRLLFDNLDANTSLGTLTGTMTVGLFRPALAAKLLLAPAQAWESVDRISLDALFPSAGRSLPLSGHVSVSASLGTKELLRVDSQVSLSQRAIDFKDLRLQRVGRTGSIIAQGQVDFSKVQPRVIVRSEINDLDISPELKTRLIVSGRVNLTSDFRSYQGDFDLNSAGEPWKKARLSGDIEGNLDQARIRLLKASMLDGSVEGEFQVSTVNKFFLAGVLRGRNLNPAAITPDWKGEINFNIGFNVEGSTRSTMNGYVNAVLLGSRLRNRPLSGKIDASVTKGLLSVAACELHGNGFDLSAHGSLEEAITYQINVTDLSGLIPHGAGRAAGKGWVRWAKGVPAGNLRADGSALSFEQARLRSFSLSIRMEKGLEGAIEGFAKVQGLRYGDLGIDSGSAEVKGTAHSHTFAVAAAWPKNSVSLEGQGAYHERAWRATLTPGESGNRAITQWTLKNSTTVSLSPERFVITPLVLATPQGDQIDVSADLTSKPRTGLLAAAWRNFNLSRLNPLLPRPALSGVTTGELKAEWTGIAMKIGCRIAANGTVTWDALKLDIEKSSLALDWDQRGLVSSWDVSSRTGARLHGQVSSPEPGHPALPERARFQTTWGGLDLALLKPFYPSQLGLQGQISGNMSGELLPGKQFNIQGETSVVQGRLEWRAKEGLMTAAINSANLTWAWQDRGLRGKVDLALSDYGRVDASFSLPIVPQLPPMIDHSGPLQIRAKGEMREKGILSALLPGVIQESRGAASFDVTAGGTCDAPVLRAKLMLTDAGAYLPSAGIHLQNVRAEAALLDDQIRVTSFSMRSGPGQVEGSATMWLKDLQIIRFEGKLKGDRFQAVYLPELQALIEPDLSFEGHDKTVSIQGTIKVPELRIYVAEKGGIRASPDVVITDETGKTKTDDLVKLDGQVRIVLGDKVRIQAAGINARLEGSLVVKARGLQDVSAQGEIRIPEGQYSASGVKLDVARGNILFKGGPPEEAVLDVLALKKLPPTPKAKEIKAGVIITGTVQSPVVKLYSDPAMSDVDTLSYILLGRARSADSEQNAALARAAAAIAAAGPSSTLQDQIMHTIGLDTVDFESPGGDTKQSVVTLGKYLSPRLYMGLGYSLFRHASMLTARYTLTKSWEIESQSGTQLGVDLYYKVEFY